jgi:hypothetical protein
LNPQQQTNKQQTNHTRPISPKFFHHLLNFKAMPYPPDSVYNVHLLGDNGRPTSTVNIMTQQGADAFLRSSSGAPYISSNLSHDVVHGMRLQLAQQTRTRQTRSLSHQERDGISDRLDAIYVMLDCIADCSTPAVFEKYVASSELQTLLDHAIAVFSELAVSPRWTKTGVLIKYNQKLLDCLISYCKHSNFVQLLVVK